MAEVVQLPLPLTYPTPAEVDVGMAKLDSAQQRLEQAQLAARGRVTRKDYGPDWPKVEGISLDEALEELTFSMLLHGSRVSFGVTDGTSDVWCRVSVPAEADNVHAGQVAFTTSTTIERAARKAAQLLPADVVKVWQPDRFAR